MKPVLLQGCRRGFKNKKEAQAAANALYHELAQGTYIEVTTISLKAFCDTWIVYYEQVGSVKISTVRERKNEVTILKKFFKTIPLRSVTKKMYQDAIIDMKTTLELADNTISGVHGCARMIFKRALEQDLITTDPIQFAKFPDELAIFLKTAQEKGLEGDYETFLTLVYTGMRVGEFTVLRETDIDFEDNSINITKTYYNPTNNMIKYELLTPKTKK